MIRRVLAITAVAIGLLTIATPAASAGVPTKVNVKNGDIACVWNLQPLNIGLCASI